MDGRVRDGDGAAQVANGDEHVAVAHHRHQALTDVRGRGDVEGFPDGDDIDRGEDDPTLEGLHLSDARVPVAGHAAHLRTATRGRPRWAAPETVGLQDTTKVTLCAVEKSMFTPAITL